VFGNLQILTKRNNSLITTAEIIIAIHLATVECFAVLIRTWQRNRYRWYAMYL